MSLYNFSNRLFVKGLIVQINAGDQQVSEALSYNFDTKIVGVKLFVSDCKVGDYAELGVFHPDPKIGELAKFGETCYLPEGSREIDVASPDTTPDSGADVPSNLIYRVDVNAIDKNGRTIIVWLLLKQ